MEDVVQLIKDKLDIVDFIKSYIQLSPAGKNYKAVCPFHKEKTPSFIVSPDRQIWHCFGACNEGGDIFKFLMKQENLEFREALRILAEKAGIDIKKYGSRDDRDYGVLYEINNSAKEFFRNNLASSNSANRYLSERGLNKETIDEFELGLALSDSDALMRYLINSNRNISDIERSGLVLKTKSGSYRDRFQNRLMFPIYNSFGKVIAFTGRILPEYENSDVGKYVNSPETPIFNKSRVIYGFHKSKQAIRQSKTAILVEGQMDFLMMWQDGVKNVAATSGTALTKDHLNILEHSAEELIMGFDSDEAGLAAIERSIDLAESQDFTVKVLELPAKDPAEVVKGQPGLISKLISEAKPATRHYFDRYLPKTALPGQGADSGQDIRTLKKNIRIILSKIKNIYSPVERARWIKDLSGLSGIEEKSLMEEMENLSETGIKTAESIGRELPKEKNLKRKDLLGERLISLILRNKCNIKYNELIERAKCLRECFSTVYRALFERVVSGEQSANLLSDQEELIELMDLRSSLENQKFDQDKLEIEFNDLVKQLKLECLKEKRQSLGEKIKKAEESGDDLSLPSALKEFDKVSQEIKNL